MNKIAFCCALVWAYALTSPALSAASDTLTIPAPAAAAANERPTRGMHMDRVLARWGEPSERLAPVGGGSPAQPPITRWVYPEFIVYFEHSLVISAVARRQSPPPAAPESAAQ